MKRAHQSTFAVVALFLATGAAWAQSDPLADCQAMYAGVGVPEYQGADPMPADGVTVLCRKGYLLSHNNQRKVPDWVLERLTPDRFAGPANRNSSHFAVDNDLPAGQRSELADYQQKDSAGKSYDRGHNAPAADMKFDQEAMDQSFLLSNMAPQVGLGFNRQIWASLEGKVRVWAGRRADLIVITGPVYGTKTLGSDKVAIPTHFYKIAYEPARHRAIALLLPNIKITGNDLKPFVTSIDHVQELTGLNFLPDLSQTLQHRLKSAVATLWEQ